MPRDLRQPLGRPAPQCCFPAVTGLWHHCGSCRVGAGHGLLRRGSAGASAGEAGLRRPGRTCYEKGQKRSRSYHRMEDLPRAPGGPASGSGGSATSPGTLRGLLGDQPRAQEGLQPPRAPVICRGLLGDQPRAQEGRQPSRAPAAGSWRTCLGLRRVGNLPGHLPRAPQAPGAVSWGTGRGRYCRTMMPEVSASTVMAEPLWMRPSRISRARRFTSSRWMRRLTGRAPKSGS